MKIQNLVIAEKYNEKTSWNKIGILITKDDGKQFVKLFHIPNTIVGVYDQKKKEDGDF